jgi:D-alanine--D-alanine ligase
MPVLVTGEDFRLPAETDVVFIALHGTFGEDGTVQRLLEDLGVPYTFSDAEASAKAFDKIISKQEFDAAGVATPRSLVVDRVRRDFTGLKEFRWPVVVKPARQGSSIGVEFAGDPGELKRACIAAGEYGDRLLVEECIRGRELTVGVLGERALPVIEICPRHRFFNYEAKYTAGETEYRVPAPLEDSARERAQRLALEAHECLGCRDMSRVDMMMDEDGELYVLEVNTIPGFTATSLVPKAAKADGMSFPDLCGQLVKKAMRRAETAAAV